MHTFIENFEQKKNSESFIPKVSENLQALVILAMGKLSIQNEDYAKSVVTVIGYELKSSKFTAVRNNCILALRDITVRSTQLVTAYIDIMANTLVDPNPATRRQTIVNLSTLLEIGYLKWSKSLFYKYLNCLLDSNEEIQQLAEYTLIDMQQTKHAGMFAKYAIDAIYYFNAYFDDPQYNQFGRTEKTKPNWTANQRMKLYRFLIRFMNDWEKFNLKERLSEEILSRLPEKIDNKRSVLNMISDVFQILTCKEIKLSEVKRMEEELADDNDVEEMDARAKSKRGKTVLAAAGLSVVRKTNQVEKVLPTVLIIFMKLEEEGHMEIIKLIVKYLIEFQKEFKTELADVLQSDRQKASELEYLMKKYQEEENRQIQQTIDENNLINPVDQLEKSMNVVKIEQAKKRIKQEAQEPVVLQSNTTAMEI